MDGGRNSTSSRREGDGYPDNATTISLQTVPTPDSPRPTTHPAELDTSRVSALHRSSTTPTRRDFAPAGRGDGSPSRSNRRRGHSVSAREAHIPIANPPRASGTKRPDESLENIPEEGRIAGLTAAQRVGTSSSKASKDSHGSISGLRRRAPTMTLPRTSAGGGTLLRRPTLLQSSGEGASNPGFTLAGPPEPAVANQHQPYVDPGYSQLNPAYEQPINVRPVWGLAKPLPRVIRPGMVPTPISGTPAENPDLEQKGEFPFDFPNPDPEKGRVDNTGINLGKVSSRLNDTREQREANFLQKVGSRTVPPPSTLAPTASQQSPGRESPVEQPQGAPSTLTPHAEEPEAEEAADEAASQTSPAKPPSNHPAFSFQGRSSLAQGRSEDGLPATRYGYRDDVSEAATEYDDQANWADDPNDLALHEFDIEDEIHRTTSDGASLDPGSTSLAWGLATMIGIYIAGGISGAHLNPAVSIMLWIYRGFPLRKVPGYVFAQVLGAFLAALISYGLYRTSILAYGGADLATGGTANAFLTNPRYAYIDASTAFFNEFVPTAILAIAILALGDDTNAPPGAGMSAFIMGMVITCESMAFSHGTGNAMNPSRDFGPRLALLALGYGGSTFRNAWWVYGPWCATISGAVVGGALYDVAIFVGGESPINYPARRIKRANRKWRRKWARRLHLQRRRGGGADIPYDKRY